jgi:hypothetical protein
MGVFGAGLYAGDFALDLRSTVRAVCRLPLPADRIVEILAESEPSAAGNPGDEDHTTFWLVIANQLAKRGVDSAWARTAALAIIDEGRDLAMRERLGASAADQRARARMLTALREALVAPVAAARRPILKKPQPLIMEVGEVFAYPVGKERPINPYRGGRAEQIVRHADGTTRVMWRQDGWGAMIVIDRGLAFGYLAWYRPLVLTTVVPVKPSIEALRQSDEARWSLASAGTCSTHHARRMELERIGRIRIDPSRLGALRPGVRQAVSDISIANSMAIPRVGTAGATGRAVVSLTDLVT